MMHAEHPVSVRSTRCNSFTKLASVLYQRIVTGAAISRIALGYCQCVSMHRRFLRVRWPDLFSRFLMGLDQLTLEIFDLIPAECALEQRLGFDIELYATLLTPAFLMLVLIALAVTLAPAAKKGCCSLHALADWPHIWDLAVWLLLLQFPTISRKTLTVFDCVQFEDTWLLRSTRPWCAMTGIGGGGRPSRLQEPGCIASACRFSPFS